MGRLSDDGNAEASKEQRKSLKKQEVIKRLDKKLKKRKNVKRNLLKKRGEPWDYMSKDAIRCRIEYFKKELIEIRNKRNSCTNSKQRKYLTNRIYEINKTIWKWENELNIPK